MKSAVTILLLITVKLTLAQPDSIQLPEYGSCNEGIVKANNNALLDTFIIMGAGIPPDYQSDFSHFLVKYYEKHYHLREYSNCIATEEVTCYNEETIRLFKVKYGTYISDSIKRYAEREYIKTIADKIERNFVFTDLDSNATFPNGTDSLISFVFGRLDSIKYPCDMFFEIIVESNGKVSDIIDKSEFSCLPFELQTWIKEMPLWTPAVCFGYNVRSKYVFSSDTIFNKQENTKHNKK